jgi:YVTN family beta-propeller protein
MKKTASLLAITSLCVVQSLCSVAWAATAGRILVANRTSGTISIIDEKTDTLIKNVSVAGKFARPPEPMYVNYSAKYNRILVNDRANNQIIAMNADTYEIQNTVPQGGGAFHMWTDGLGMQTWSVNDADKTFTVINPGNLKILKTIPIPADLAAQGGKPHDILLDKKAKWAFTTIVGIEGDNDYVVQYSTKTFKEIGRFATGKDPHVGILNDDSKLFVPTQMANKVYVLDPNKITKKTIKKLKELDIPSAHGITWMPNNQFAYVTNVAGEALKGSKNHNGLWAINTKTMKIVGSSALPKLKKLAAHTHNVTVNATGTKLYLTHSGHEIGTVEGDVTVWNISSKKPVPVYAKKRIHVGLNPFGITYIPGR